MVIIKVTISTFAIAILIVTVILIVRVTIIKRVIITKRVTGQI